jgi:hypothetical protein
MALAPLPIRQLPIAGDEPPSLDNANYFLSLDQLLRSSGVGVVGSVNADANGAGHALTVANFLGGFLLRSGPGGAFADTTPSAADIVQSIPKAIIGTYRVILISNSGGGLMTLNAGAGVTLQGTTTIAEGSARWYLLTVTNANRGAEAVTLRGLMTGAV